MKKRLKVIIKFTKSHRGKFFILFFCIMATTFTGSLYPYIFGYLVDEILYSKNFSIFLNIFIVYGIIFFVNQMLHFVLNIIWAKLMTRFLFDIRKAIYEKVLSYGGETLSSLRSGDIVYRMGLDAEQFMNYIHWNTFYLMARIINLIISIGFIAYLSRLLALITLIMTLISVYISRFFSKKLKMHYTKITEESGVLSSFIFEIIKGMQEIRFLSAGKSVISDYVTKTLRIIRLKLRTNKIEVISERINSGISLICQLILYTTAAFLIYNGKFTVGKFTTCVSYFGTCISVFNTFNNHLAEIKKNFASVDRVCNILEGESEDYKADAPGFDIEHGKIKFDNVSFSYNKKVNVLNRISFTISPGERIALVGRSGAGKSTIANLILKLYNIQQGKILIDGMDISKCNLQSLRSQIGIVNQDMILFNGTIRYNLIFSNNNTRDKEILNILKKVHLHDFVISLPDGLDTFIEFNGRSMSMGQKQRFAIARVFLKNPKILILDEATSSIDGEAEQLIKESWDHLFEGRTVIIIAHRLDTIINADKILVLDNQKIVGFDTHVNLLNSCEVYAKLFKEQYLQKGASVHV